MTKLLTSPLPDGTTSYLEDLAHAALLTRKGEIEIAKRIEASEREVLAAYGGRMTCEPIRHVYAKALARVELGNLRSFLEGRAEP